MGDSYNAEEEYQKFADEQYHKFRGALESALETSGDKPVLLVIGRTEDGGALNWLYNVAASDKDERYPDAAAYSLLAAVRASEDIVGKYKTMLSLQLEPDVRDYAMKNMGLDVVGIRRSLQPFTCDIAGYMGLQGYRVSYSDAAFRKTNDLQERVVAEINDINKMGSLEGYRQPSVIVHYVDSERLGMLHGHSRENLFENGDDLRNHDAKSPFDKVFAAVLSYNVGNNVVGFGEEREALLYAQDRFNAQQIETPGELPDNYIIEDVMQAVNDASDDYKLAHDGEKGIELSHQILENVASPVSMKL